jgi:plasmid stability protein
VETRNITFNLPTELIRRAKIYAAEHDISINAVVRDLLEKALSSDDQALIAAGEFLAIAKRVPPSAVDPGTIRREEMYERR